MKCCYKIIQIVLSDSLEEYVDFINFKVIKGEINCSNSVMPLTLCAFLFFRMKTRMIIWMIESVTVLPCECFFLSTI